VSNSWLNRGENVADGQRKACGRVLGAVMTAVPELCVSMSRPCDLLWGTHRSTRQGSPPGGMSSPLQSDPTQSLRMVAWAARTHGSALARVFVAVPTSVAG